jgi:hypothetical protein
MSGFRANSIVSRDGTGAPNFPNGIVATGATFTGEISGVNGTFSGNLTIGGTVSYQEVENIDAVGVITAQQGIQVEANGLTVTGVGTFNNSIEVVGVTTADANGLNVAGVITATTLKGSGANLTGILPTLSGIASGALTNGQTVIIQSDGTVTGVATAGIAQTVGSDVVWRASTSESIVSVYDSSNEKVVVMYNKGVGDDAQAIVGTVSGVGTNSTVSFGSTVTIHTDALNNPGAAFDSSNNKVVLAYRDPGNSYYGTAIVGTVSGTSISFGSEVVYTSNNAPYTKVIFDSTNNKVVIFFRGASNYGRAIVGTVSGTSISFGSEATFATSSVNAFDATFDSNSGKAVICYRDPGNSSRGTAKVGTVSGTSISFGSATVFETGATADPNVTFDSSNNKVVAFYQDESNSSKGTAVVGTVTGTGITFGTPVLFNDGGTAAYPFATFDSNANKVVVSYRDGGRSNKRSFRVGTVSDDTITFGARIGYTESGNNVVGLTFDSSNKKVVVSYTDSNNSSYGTSKVLQNASVSTNLTSTNFLGFSDAAYSDGDTATIQITGATDDAQSGLTTARKHYVQNDGTLSTTAGDPSVEAGVAISDTTIIVKG